MENKEETHMMNEDRMIREEDRIEEEPMIVAVDSLVNFSRRNSSLYREAMDEDGLVAVEVARMAQFCMMEAAS